MSGTSEIRRAYRQRILLLSWTTLEVLFLAGPLYGWASFVVVLKQDGYFSSLCPRKGNDTNVAGSPAEETDLYSSCSARDERFSLIFSVAFFVTYFAASVPCGLVYDKLGPRPARFAASVLFAGSGAAMIMSTYGFEDLLFVGTSMLAVGGYIVLITSFQIANLFSLWGNTVLFLLNGAFDSSAVVLEMFKKLNDAGVALRHIYIVYYGLAVISTLLFTFCFLPSKIIETNPLGKKSQKATKERALLKTEEKANGNAMEMTELSSNNEQELSIVHKEGDECLLLPEGTTLCRLMLSSPFIWHVACLSMLQLRMWFFVGTLNPYIVRLSACHQEVSMYTDIFGLAQFSGIFFNLVVGLIMDEFTQTSGDKIHSFIIGFIVTICTGIIMSSVVLVPDLRLQVITFFSYTALRGLCYSCYTSLLQTGFPLVYMGFLYSAGMLIAALIGSLQYALFIAVQNVSSGDPFWLNVIFLLMTFIACGHPVNLRRMRKRSTRTSCCKTCVVSF